MKPYCNITRSVVININVTSHQHLKTYIMKKHIHRYSRWKSRESQLRGD